MKHILKLAIVDQLVQVGNWN